MMRWLQFLVLVLLAPVLIGAIEPPSCGAPRAAASHARLHSSNGTACCCAAPHGAKRTLSCACEHRAGGGGATASVTVAPALRYLPARATRAFELAPLARIVERDVVPAPQAGRDVPEPPPRA